MLKEPESPRPSSQDNDTRPVSGKGDNRLLLWCLIASLFINFGFGLWMTLADVYGTQRTKEEIKRAPIKTYHPPPIKKKPKPIPPKPKIIPPKLVKMIHPPKPTPQPRPVPHPSPPHYAPLHTGSHSTSHNAIPVAPPDTSAPPAPATPTVPDAPPTPQTPTPPAPPPYVPPAPPVQKYVPPPPPPAPKRPSNYQAVDSQEANVTGVDAPDPGSVSDPTQITGPCVVSFEVGETGSISSVRVKKSSGSHEFDELCMDAVRKAHGVFAVQDHIPYAQRAEQTFSQ